MRSPLSILLVLAGIPGAACGAQSALPSNSPAGDLPAALVETAARLRDEALAGTSAYDHVRSLTTEVGPRLAGSAGDRAAVAWGVRKLKELGFANVRSEPAKVPHWERGAASGEILAPYPQPVVLTALGGSVSTPAAGLEAEVVAAATVDELKKLPAEQVRGRIVFLDTRMKRARDGSGYGAAVASRSTGALEAGRLGAAAVVIRSIGTASTRLPHTGAMRYEDGVAKIPAAALSNPDADLLAAQLATGKPVRFRLHLETRSLPDATSANVVGELPGREAPDEIVLLGCHLDSWDLGTGALDDGAGCAIVIEAARRIGQLPQRPRRTVRVVLFANEENGLGGAKAYAEAHADELARHILAGESDFGDGKVWRIRSKVAPDRLPLFAALARLLAPLGVAAGDNDNDAGGGADLIPLIPARVPVVSLGQDGSRYFDYHHTADDTLDKVDAESLDQNVAAWAALFYAAAEMPGDFGRAPE